MPTQTEILTAHTVDVQRFATELLRTRVFPTLKDARKAAQLILLEYPEITGVTQLNEISRAIRRELNPILTESWEGVTGEMREFSHMEAAFMAATIASVNDLPPLRVPVNEQIDRFINRALMSLASGRRDTAGTWVDFVNQSISSTIQTFDSQVKAGFANGETINQISRRLRTVEEGLLQNESEALARTGVQHYAVQARNAMANQNKDVIAREVPVITFDNRLSATCLSIGSRYGQKGWPAGDSPVGYPPYHFNCRTAIVYLVNGQESLEGERASIGGKKGAAAAESFENRQERTDKKVRYRRRGDKAFKPGQIKADTWIDSWLRSQPRWFVESTLGSKKKTDAFLNGRLSLDKFTDLTGAPLSIAQLAALYPKYFD